MFLLDSQRKMTEKYIMTYKHFILEKYVGIGALFPLSKMENKIMRGDF